ncbi:MAG TPA: zinc-ribbon domain-containing protein [Saprospiraceae bacterium]|nr:zinc-ribbon domain-containing protein [Saprospiraceae bacterium]
MKVKCKVCGTTKVVKDAKLIPYKGKVISVSCANKNCSHRIKFKVPLDLGATQDKKEEPKNTTQVTVDKPETSKETFIVCPKCNASLPEETSFCTNCGHNLKEPIAENISKKTVKKYCKKCGHLLEPEAKFCLQCGEPVFPKVSIQETKETNEVPPKKQQEKPKASTHKKPESAVQKQAVPKKKVKQKSGVLGLIFKILLILV